MPGAKEIRNIAESIRAKLRNISKENGRDFDAVLLQFFQERLLYRVSISSYQKSFVLKGALLLRAKSISPFRPTKDIDFLGKGINADLEHIKNTFKEILLIQCSDEVTFSSDNIDCSIIKEGADYEGVCLKIEARLGSIRKRIHVDIGFGDLVFGGPTEFEYPVLLDFPPPILQGYTLESVIAEKFQAIVWLNFQTSRMKDFYDILFLAATQVYESTTLMKAIQLTFGERHTYIEQKKWIFSKEFKDDSQKQIQWTAYLNKNNLKEETNFHTMVEKIEQFIDPLFTFNENADRLQSWDNKNWIWSPCKR